MPPDIQDRQALRCESLSLKGSGGGEVQIWMPLLHRVSIVADRESYCRVTVEWAEGELRSQALEGAPLDTE